MTWKDWPYWLKGGILAILLILALSFLFGIFIMFKGDIYIFRSLFYIFVVPGMILIAARKFSMYGYEIPDINFFDVFIMTTFSIGLYFIIGALIGWIYSKIKSKK